MDAIADTSGLIAVFSKSEPDHTAALESVKNCPTLVLNPMVLLEMQFLLLRDTCPAMVDVAVEWVLRKESTGEVMIPEISGDTLRRAEQVRRHYAALNLDLTDAVNVVVADNYATNVILTLDRRDFRVIRPLSIWPAFHLLPDDGPPPAP